MKFPLSLLTRFLTTDSSLDVISATLTNIGIEVESIEDRATALQAFVVAEILEAERHPQADKLQVCKVKTLSGTLQIVCGAPNARAGIKVALANIGTIIPTNGMQIKKAAVRGVESQGMLCSAAELGLGADGGGIIELPLDAPIGQSIVETLNLNDPIIDVAITANRGDCMGVYGIARDLTAAGLGTLKVPCVPSISASDTSPISITIADSEGCPAFIGRVIRGVKNAPSPQWLQDVLTKSGMRSISTLVDITNYFTLAFGRPLHTYDLTKLRGNITVRQANEGEEFAALNEKNYRLNTQCCVIADDSGAVAIGGIMGGSSTGVSDTTTDILLEVALFDSLRIAKTGRALQIDSDARARFERGVDAGFMQLAELRATEMILELCGGMASQPSIAGSIPTIIKTVVFDVEAINRLGGTNIPEAQMIEILTALGFTISGNSTTVPSWRHDISQPQDLAEEVLRIVGYDAIASVPLPKPAHIVKSVLNQTQARLTAIRHALAARGLHETYGWGFVSPAQAAQFGGQPDSLHLLNPISAELSVMRPSLLPHLLTAVANNAARGQKNLALFEQGAIFVDATPNGQRNVAAGVRCGLRDGEVHWRGTAATDIFDVKADVGAVLALAGLDINKLQIQANTDKTQNVYHPGRSGSLTLGKTVVAHFGELHPALLKSLDIDFPVMAFEVMLDALPPVKSIKRKAIATSDYQAVNRDFAFVLDATIPSAELVLAIQKAEKNLLQNVTLFDVYAGKGIEPGKKSLGVTITLQAADRTLSQAEIDAVAQAVIAAAAKVGALLR
jgi:phenylalanyl-tRNA synthetase beta chain